ncbi:Antxrl [Phodopus roborovskii]|uniref:Antxrl protein n=1 Tax=Phodopus roborovskii TaxID=109678 RepID=A0AAV0AAR5_PHORO|nr:Antxrl [Phodopus roborovskii]
MGIHIPRVPYLALLLFLLLLNSPLSKARSLQYHGPGWKLFQRLGKGSSISDEQQIQQMNWNQRQLEDNCQGVFDLYIILDKSGSVGRNWIYVYSFTEDLVKKFQNPKLRISIITYSTFADVIIPLTSDREAIRKGLAILHEEVPEGFTHMQDGFKKVQAAIGNSVYRSKLQSVIIAMTDGLLMEKHFKQTMEEAKISRQLGATVLTVGVYHYDKWQKTGGPCMHSLRLTVLPISISISLSQIASKSCIQVFSVTPSYVCTKDPYQVTINGRGFKNTNDLSQVICRFTFSDSRVVDESPTDITDNTMNLSLEVSLNNGISFIGNRLVITGTNCGSTKPEAKLPDPVPVATTQGKPINTPNTSAGGGFIFNWNWLLFLPVLLVVIMLLICCCRLCCKKVKSPSPSSLSLPLPALTPTHMSPLQGIPKEPPPPPPPPQPEKVSWMGKRDPGENLPPPTSPPAPSPPSPSPINPNPTVIVACCGCGNRGGNLDTCCSYFYPSCHQMPLMCCHSKVQGQCASTTVVNPSCLCSDRDCVPITQQPCTTRIVLQPNRECFNVSQAPCNQKVCLPTSTECFPIAQTLCSKMCLPHKERYILNYSQSPCTNKCTRTPSRVLPLLPPHIRKSVESFCHNQTLCPSSKEQK